MNKLINLFCKLVSIPSPSGKESAVTNFIKDYLEQKNIKTNIDDYGNLIATIPGDVSLPTLLFVAHMDTVETGDKPIKAIINGNIIETDKTTILGADDKASVACLLDNIDEIIALAKHPNIIFAFTVREEDGKMGSSMLNIPDKIDYCFNLDGSIELGVVVSQTLGEMPFKIIIKGLAAHAAIEPEKGINAIITAAKIIDQLPIGKDENDTTLNIGTISGGKANNIVPDEVIINGSTRAFDQENIDSILEKLKNIIQTICDQTKCTYEIILLKDESVPCLPNNTNQEILKIIKKANNVMNLPYKIIKGSYCSDANFLSTKYPTITLCRGSKFPHSVNEQISIDNLQGFKNLVLEIIKQVLGN